MLALLQILIRLSIRPELLRFLGQLKHPDWNLQGQLEMNIEIDRLPGRTPHEGIGSMARTENILMPDEMTGLQMDVLRHMARSITVDGMMILSQALSGREMIG